VLTAIAIIPSAPVLVPQLAGAAAAELTDVREAVFAAAGVLPKHWLAVGVGPADAVVGPQAAGTFAGYGVDVRAELSADADEVGDLPLCALITAWVRGEARPGARAEVRVFNADHDAADALRSGRELRIVVDQPDEAIGVLVVADGANTLTPRAPGGHDRASVAVQAALDRALAAGDVAALARLPASITGRVAWQVLAGLAGVPPRSAKELYRGAPFGVGYFVGVWMP
jgi:hypothetical protein